VADDSSDGVPFITVAIPTKNRSALLSYVVETLLRQDYPSNRYEVVPVDDGSTEDT